MKRKILNIKKLKDNAKVPEKRDGDAAYDLFSCEEATLMPMDIKVVRTGISIEIPNGIRGQIYPRSGLAVKNGIHVLAGKIDPSYRGEILVVLINLGKARIDLPEGSKIAQIEFNNFIELDMQIVMSLSETNRGSGGFGSTGL